MGKNETTRVRRTFTPQFNRDAVKLVNEGKSITEVARDLGIARSLLQRWRMSTSGSKRWTMVSGTSSTIEPCWEGSMRETAGLPA
jgi:transposase-like protein